MRVLLADAEGLMRAGVRQSLMAAADIEIVGEAVRGPSVLPMVRRLRPEVVLLGVHMPELDGFSCLELLARHVPELKIVMLASSSDPGQVSAALSRGAAGYIVKSIGSGDLAAALRQIVEGTVFSALSTRSANGSRPGDLGLTDREVAILRGAAAGRSNREIGRELWVTEQTVKFHLTNIYRKLKVVNRTEAARAAYRLGIAESPVLDMAVSSVG